MSKPIRSDYLRSVGDDVDALSLVVHDLVSTAVLRIGETSRATRTQRS